MTAADHAEASLRIGRRTNAETSGGELVFRDEHGNELGRDTIAPAARTFLRELAQDDQPTSPLLGQPARGLCNFEYTRTSVAGRREGERLHLIWREEHGHVLAEDDLTGAEREALIAWLERAR